MTSASIPSSVRSSAARKASDQAVGDDGDGRRPLLPQHHTLALHERIRRIVEGHGQKRLWTLDEWAFFLDDLRDHVLKPEGRFALKLAKQEHKGDAGLKRGDQSLVSFMESRGATQQGTVLVFAPLR
jgi:hypothetical protein